MKKVTFTSNITEPTKFVLPTTFTGLVDMLICKWGVQPLRGGREAKHVQITTKGGKVSKRRTLGSVIEGEVGIVR